MAQLTMERGARCARRGRHGLHALILYIARKTENAVVLLAAPKSSLARVCFYVFCQFAASSSSTPATGPTPARVGTRQWAQYASEPRRAAPSCTSASSCYPDVPHCIDAGAVISGRSPSTHATPNPKTANAAIRRWESLLSTARWWTEGIAGDGDWRWWWATCSEKGSNGLLVV